MLLTRIVRVATGFRLNFKRALVTVCMVDRCVSSPKDVSAVNLPPFPKAVMGDAPRAVSSRRERRRAARCASPRACPARLRSGGLPEGELPFLRLFPADGLCLPTLPRHPLAQESLPRTRVRSALSQAWGRAACLPKTLPRSLLRFILLGQVSTAAEDGFFFSDSFPPCTFSTAGFSTTAKEAEFLYLNSQLLVSYPSQF